MDPDHWSDRPASSEWDGSADTGQQASRHAALMLWVTGGLEVLMFGFCSAAAMAIGLMPADQLRKLASAQKVNTAQFKELLKNQNALLPDAVIMFVLLVLPAMLLIWLGFGVRRGKPMANKIARIILYIQILVVAMVIVSSFLTGGGASIFMVFVVFGSLLVMLIATARACLLARDAERANSAGDPWNQP